jgi:DNA invertase Pin-like site-specific DNA recombinase
VSAKVIPLPDPKPVRCAIYTRKSTEEGLDQEFNSLDAQRECAEAYIQSQRHERWTLIPHHYDDGGFTGANIDRPALKQLLADVEAGNVDCVVVYKVDRLSRSLLDFARVMEVFDKRGVSFVSVTQQLNTNSPMGRLTLNVLLSFAQFEREIISERTRDKVCAARRKGKWTGGYPVLGYDIEPLTRKLAVNETEAEQVRRVFEIFLRKRAIVPTLWAIDRAGIKLKSWTTKKGREAGGRPYDRGSLVRLLTNISYVGDINHKGTIYKGEQPAILEREVWERANEVLAGLGRGKETRRRISHESLLSPLLYCAVCGSRMISGCATAHGRRYPYYVCIKAQKRGSKACPGQTVRSDRVESAVVEAARSRGVCHGTSANLKELLHEAIERMDCNVRARQVRLHFKPHDGPGASFVDVELPEPRIDTRPRVRARKTVATAPSETPRISELMALAIRYEALMEHGAVDDFTEIAEQGSVTRARVTQIMNLRNLAPSIQEQLLILSGETRITERDLRAIANQLSWAKQIRMFRLLAPGMKPKSAIV